MQAIPVRGLASTLGAAFLLFFALHEKQVQPQEAGPRLNDK